MTYPTVTINKTAIRHYFCIEFVFILQKNTLHAVIPIFIKQFSQFEKFAFSIFLFVIYMHIRGKFEECIYVKNQYYKSE